MGSASNASNTGDMIPVNVGQLSVEQIKLIYNHLPMDLTFVDENDDVRFFSRNKEELFERSPDIIGTKVQNCHSEAYVGMVNRILDEFRRGTKDTAEFWMDFDGRFVYIRYLAVRDDAGNYRGVLEVCLDAGRMKALEGEKRLLDWDD